VSKKIGDGMIVYTLFNRSERKYRKRKPQRQRRRVLARDVVSEMKHILSDYKHCRFTFRLRTYMMCLPKYRLKIAAETVDKLVHSGHIPTRISLLVKDLIA